MSNVSGMPKRDEKPASTVSQIGSTIIWIMVAVTVLLPINIFLVRLAAGWL